MRSVIFGSLVLGTLVAATAWGQERCICDAANLTPCGGTGPMLRTYLWSDEQRRSRNFDVTRMYRLQSPQDCRAIGYTPVPHVVPVFNYYGDLVHGCAVVWKNCGVQ